jgi:pimeloyl-ACP methyl ester carboxylesterase
VARPARLLAALVAAVVILGAPAAPARVTHSCVRGNELWFRAADGTRLVGHRFGGGGTAVVLAHQSDGDLCEWVPYARRLAARGYFVFPFDFRGHGFSRQGRETRLGADVAAAVRAVRGLGKRRVIVVGASMGGVAAVVGAASVRPPIDRVVSLSAPAFFRGIDAVRAARRLRVPVLYVAAEQDQGGRFASDARRLYAATASADKRVELAAGDLHGIAMLESAGVRQLVEAFITSG